MKTYVMGGIALAVLAGGAWYFTSQNTPMAEAQTAKPGDTLLVHYEGRLADDTVFDSSYEREAPIQFTLGTGAVIQGWDEGVEGMRVGQAKELVIPPEKAYGETGVPGTIPPNATLYFTVELIDIL